MVKISNIKYDLVLNDRRVSSLEELREHAAPELLKLFLGGRLEKFLVSRGYSDEELDKLRDLWSLVIGLWKWELAEDHVSKEASQPPPGDPEAETLVRRPEDLYAAFDFHRKRFVRLRSSGIPGPVDMYIDFLKVFYLALGIEREVNSKEIEQVFLVQKEPQGGQEIPFLSKELVKQTDNPFFAERAEVQFCLGVCYYNGQGVTQDYAEAVKWYRKAADQGYAYAQLVLGCCYANSQGVSLDHAEAVKWYRKAAEQGLAHAQFRLGLCYFKGQGVLKDCTEARMWFCKAADQGHAGAQNNLGVCYGNGNGVPQDHAEEVKWYRKAVDQGNANAQFNLGLCCNKGQGVPLDHAEAAKWFRKAVDQGHAEARRQLEL